MQNYRKYLLTSIIVLFAIVLVAWKFWDYVVNPWTRNGQVRADVIQVTPRVSAPIVSLPIIDNQFVEAGQVLFKIDPRTFQAALDQARAEYDRTGDNYIALEKQVEAAEADVAAAKESVAKASSAVKEVNSVIEKNQAEYQRQLDMLPQKATSQKAVERAKASYEVSLEQRTGALAAERQARASLKQAQAMLAEAQASLGALGDANPSIRAARAAVRQAELNLEFTEVRAPMDGYVTNLNLRLGTQTVANQPALALIDTSSYWVDGFFRETVVGKIQPGDKVIVTLMSYPDEPIEGVVESLGWGISQQDGSTGFELLPTVSPTFEWIRLAQRIPVRIRLDEIPENVSLRVGTTASVLVRTGTAESGQ